MSVAPLWFQIDQLPLLPKLVGGVGFIGIIVWALSLPLLLLGRLSDRLARLKTALGEMLAIQANQSRAGNQNGLLFAFGLLQDFNGRAQSLLIAQQHDGVVDPIFTTDEMDQLSREALLKLRVTTSQKTRVYALRLLALLKPDGSWKAVLPYLKRPEAPEFIPAAKALLQLDCERAIRIILRLGMKHWALNRHVLGRLIVDVPTRIIEKAFVDLLVEGGSGDEARLIALMPYLGESGRLIPLRTFLPIRNRAAWLTMAIRLINDSSQLPLVRPFLKHPDSAIRFYAAKALGKHGGRSDLPALKGMMFRESPSVRRAAMSAYVSIIGRATALPVTQDEALSS